MGMTWTCIRPLDGSKPSSYQSTACFSTFPKGKFHFDYGVSVNATDSGGSRSTSTPPYDSA